MLKKFIFDNIIVNNTTEKYDPFDPFTSVKPNMGSEPNDNNFDIAQYDKMFFDFLSKYRNLIITVFAILFITLIAVFIYYLIQLSYTGGNPTERSKAIKNLVMCGIATAIMGSATVIFGLAFFVFV